MVIQFGGLRDAHPPYDGVEGGCLLSAVLGAGRDLLFYGEFIGEAVGYVGAAYHLREAVRGVRQRYPFHIDAWVVLPDHLHASAPCRKAMQIFPPAGGSSRPLSPRRCRSPSGARRCGWRAGKARARGSYERQRSWPGPKAALLGALRMQRAIWQRRFWEHAICDEWDYARHMDYIHYNPVKHRYVERVGDWPYSTFHRYVAGGVYPPDWAGVPVSALEAGERV